MDYLRMHLRYKAVQRSSQRLLLCLTALFPGLKIFTRDVSQAYTQSETTIPRKVFVYLPRELGLSKKYGFIGEATDV